MSDPIHVPTVTVREKPPRELGGFSRVAWCTKADEAWMTGSCPHCNRLYKIRVTDLFNCPCGRFQAMMTESGQRFFSDPPAAWSPEPPKSPGWYWWRPKPGVQAFVVKVYFAAGGELFAALDPAPIHEWPGQWSGPLVPPP